jgi:hypothetical protein
LGPFRAKPRKSLDAQRYGHKSSQPQLGLPPSQSEPTLHSLSPEKAAHAAYYSPPGLPQTPPPSSPAKSRSRQESSRGRSRSRELNGEIGDDVGDISPSKRSKRSRSPVKRLLGIGKSARSQESRASVMQEPNTPCREGQKTPTAASSTKKSSLKQWSDKFRHGFLVSDPSLLRTC